MPGCWWTFLKGCVSLWHANPTYLYFFETTDIRIITTIHCRASWGMCNPLLTNPLRRQAVSMQQLVFITLCIWIEFLLSWQQWGLKSYGYKVADTSSLHLTFVSVVPVVSLKMWGRVQSPRLPVHVGWRGRSDGSVCQILLKGPAEWKHCVCEIMQIRNEGNIVLW